jgi:uncharacterized damage-inducible protein DinB
VSRSEVLATVETSWNQLQQAIAGIDSETASKPGVSGDWSVKDLLGHIAFWDNEALKEAERRAGGQPPRQVDWQAMNDEDYAANKERPFDELRQLMLETHEDVVTRLTEINDLDPAAIKDDTWGHYDEHRSEIEAWREREGI